MGQLLIAGGCSQRVDHFFKVDEVINEDPIRVSAGGAIKLQWNMEWRSFEPKLWFYLRAKGDDPKAKLPCDLTPMKGTGLHFKGNGTN